MMVAAPLIVSVSVEAVPNVTAPPDSSVIPSSVTLSLNVAPPEPTVTSCSNVTRPPPTF